MKPLSLPANTRPATTVGCAFDDSPVGKPNAHFSFNRGTSAAVRSAEAAGWKRVLPLSLPQPFQPAPAAGSVMGGLLVHLFGMPVAAPAFALPIGRPAMNSAILRFWPSDKPSDCSRIVPVVSV